MATNDLRRRRVWRVALPASVLGLLVWVMVGCIYVPTWERVQLTGAEQDFRPLVGSAKDGQWRFAADRVTRSEVERLLGRPPYASADGRRVAYTLTSRRGLWVVPLCLSVGSGTEKLAALGLEYGPDGVVASYAVRYAAHDLAKFPPFETSLDGPHGEYTYDEAVRSLPYTDLRATGFGTGLPLDDPRFPTFNPTRPASRPLP